MNDDVMSVASPDEVPASPTARPEHLHFPLRGLAGEGADDAVRQALAGLAGIQSVQISTGMAVAEVVFDAAVVSADVVRARLAGAGQRGPKLDDEGAR